MNFPAPAEISTYHNKSYPTIDISRPKLSAAGKTVFIIGGGSGLGLAFAQHFAKAGCTRIVITGRRSNVLNAAKSSLEKEFNDLKLLALQGDVTDRTAVEAAFRTSHETFGTIDVLINNAGYLPDLGPISSALQSDWWKGFEINVLGSFNVLSSFVPVGAQNAVVVNTTSAAVNARVPGESAYSASKVATTRLFEHFQDENPGLRVVNVAPGVVVTDMGRKAVHAFEVMGLPLPPEDDIRLPASYLVWAASAEAEFIKGKFVWVNWDVDELKHVIENAESKHILTLGVIGCQI
ncbi:NAD(P)-binding protein [Ophiobolus disseminans]|uniref:NAD(P)-binding protein n=1 Tax=Ophiobolus disseminans TaxID=1469910 RepID=A0A6A6ZSL1_9PLEO|nr:NAD(P)-binding protein [Ophiobolus disseminans]